MRMVLIDVWPRVRPRAGGRIDFFQCDYEGAAMLQSLAIGHGIAIVALFHTRKAVSADFVETVQGAFGTAAAADTSPSSSVHVDKLTPRCRGEVVPDRLRPGRADGGATSGCVRTRPRWTQPSEVSEA